MNEFWGDVANSLRQAPWGWALLITALITLIKIWPVLRLQTLEARAVLRKEKRDDLNDCQRRLDEMSKTISKLSEEVGNLRIELNGVLSAYRILDIECEATNPRSLGLAQARAILSAAFTIAPSTAHMHPEKPDGPERMDTGNSQRAPGVPTGGD